MAFVEYVNNTVIGRVHRDTRDPCTNLYARLHKSIVFFFFFFSFFFFFFFVLFYRFLCYHRFIIIISLLSWRQ